MTIRIKLILSLLLTFGVCKLSLGQATAAQSTIVPELSATNLQRLIDTAIKNYPRVRYFENRIGVSEANVSKIKATWLEALTLSYVYQPYDATVNPVNPTSTYFKGAQAGVFLNLGNLLSKPQAIKQAKREVLTQKDEYDEYVLKLTAEVKRRYYTYILRIAELKLQVRAADDAEAHLKDFKLKFEKGEETFDSYSKVLIQHTEHLQTKVAAEANVYIAKADVEEMIGTKLENVIK